MVVQSSLVFRARSPHHTFLHARQDGIVFAYVLLFVAWRVLNVIELAAWPFQLFEYVTYHVWCYVMLWLGVGAPSLAQV